MIAVAGFLGLTSAVFLVFPMLAFTFGINSMPVTHPLVFAVVFGWAAFTSTDLLLNKKLKKESDKKQNTHESIFS